MKAISAPFLQPAPNHCRISAWNIVRDGQEQPLPQVVEDWDPAMDLHLRTMVQIDVPSILSECGLNVRSRLQIGVVWESAGTGLRGCGNAHVLDESMKSFPQQLLVSVRGTDVLDSLTFRIRLTTTREVYPLSPLAPSRPGAVLFERVTNIELGSQSSRFPIEMLNFRTDFPHAPSNSGWYLDWAGSSSVFDTPVAGGLRLMVNSEHAVVSAAVRGSAESDSLVRSAIVYDVAHTLISRALNDNEFVEENDTYPSGTIGAAVRQLVLMTFDTESIAQAAAEFRDRPERCRTRLQGKLRLFGGAIS